MNGCAIRNRNCLPFASTYVHPRPFDGAFVTHNFNFLCCISVLFDFVLYPVPNDMFLWIVHSRLSPFLYGNVYQSNITLGLSNGQQNNVPRFGQNSFCKISFISSVSFVLCLQDSFVAVG